MVLSFICIFFAHSLENLSTFKEERKVKTNKLMALVLAAVMVLSLIPAAAAETAPSLDFEDGNIGFVAVYEGMANSAAATLEVVDYNGSKALKVTNDNGVVNTASGEYRGKSHYSK